MWGKGSAADVPVLCSEGSASSTEAGQSLACGGWGSVLAHTPLLTDLLVCPPDEEYSESQALILTFSLNNFPPSDPRYGFVMLWEEQFLQIVREFQQENLDKYTVAYMAEVGLPHSPHHLGGRPGQARHLLRQRALALVPVSLPLQLALS